jgi:hypothetical protein
MNSFKLLLFVFLLFIAKSCDDNQDNQNLTQQQESEILSQLFSEIEAMASSEECINASDWTFTAYGSKACGGPMGFIAYSTNIDTTTFLEKIEEHEIAQQAFNEKWAIVSDCSIPAEPSDVICENGNPVFVY